MQLGNGAWEGTAFNSRMQPTGIALGSTPGASNLLDLAYTYNTKNGSADNPDNNGNVLTQTIIVNDVGSNPGFDAVQTYTYDPLNRIETAEEVIDESSPAAWTQEFIYDRYGNRNFKESTTTTLTKNCGTSPNFVMCDADRERENPEIDKDTNRIEELQPDGDQDEDYEFDAAGNTILDPDGRQFFYDGENKQIRVEDISDNAIGEYVYDGDGRRVMKKVPVGGNTETTVFVYDAGGKLVAEYSTTVASQSTAQVSYLTNDHLGSPRITTDKNGKVYSRRDFLPFGEDLDINVTAERTSAIGYGPDSVRQKFTGYERDDETELDFAQARMHNYGHGRFTSPDPLAASASSGQPQSWNRYTYVMNAPLRLTDSTGLVPDILVQGNEQGAYLERLQKETPSLVLRINPNTSKVEIIGFRNDHKDGDDWVGNEEEIVSQMSENERALYNAISNTQNTATIDTTRGDGNIDFGRYDGPGRNTIDMQDLDVIDASGDVGFTSSQVVGHETLEAYTSVQGNASDPNLQRISHSTANQHFPGLGPLVGGGVTPFVDSNNNIRETEERRPIQDNSGTIVTLRYVLVNPVPLSPNPQLNPRHLKKITK